MAFLGSIGKFVGGVVGQVAKAAPTALVGFATGGPPGAAKGLLTGLLTQQQGGFQTSGNPLFGGVQNLLGSFTQPSANFPQPIGPQVPMQGGAIPTGGAVMLTESLFNIILKLAQSLGHTFKSANSVHRWGRMIIARLLRFARANPGLTVFNLLANLGLGAVEINELLTWWATSGKKRRRIKVTNVKALNRSVRRLEGFRRLSHRVEAALSRRGSTRAVATRRRCPRCRKSPCCC